MKVLLLLLTILSTNTYASVNVPAKDYGLYVGASQTKHIIGKHLNEFHPMAGLEFKSYGIIGYKNSFDRASFGAYYNYKDALTKRISFNTKFGLVSGYEKQMELGDMIYNVNGIFIGKLMILAVPSLDLTLGNTRFSVELVGDAVSIAFRIFVN